MSFAAVIQAYPTWFLKLCDGIQNKSSETNCEVLKIMSNGCSGSCAKQIKEISDTICIAKQLEKDLFKPCSAAVAPPAGSSFSGKVPGSTNFSGKVPGSTNFSGKVPGSANFSGKASGSTNFSGKVPGASSYIGSARGSAGFSKTSTRLSSTGSSSVQKEDIPAHIYKSADKVARMEEEGQGGLEIEVVREEPTISRFCQLLHSIREPLADYQEKRGLPREEHGSFVNLITSLCQHAYNAALIILTMLYNLLPLFDGFMYFARFIVDKLIDICETEDMAEKILKFLMFVAEMIVIVILLMIIFGLILLPVWQLFSYLIFKFWGMLAG